MRFEWDETKRRTNLEKHDMDFRDGHQLFDGRAVITGRSAFEGEERWVTVGLVNERYLTLVWTLRGTSIRIISLRRARNGEKRAYRELHG